MLGKYIEFPLVERLKYQGCSLDLLSQMKVPQCLDISNYVKLTPATNYCHPVSLTGLDLSFTSTPDGASGSTRDAAFEKLARL
jgi:hypothetical protein